MVHFSSGDGGSLSLVNFNEHSTQIHSWQKCVANGDGSVEKLSFVAGKLLYHSVILLFEVVAASMEIKRRHYFHSDIHSRF